MHRLNAILKMLLSYRKRVWEFEDYPVRTSQIAASDDTGDGRWRAEIVKWSGMIERGKTEEEAVQALREAFERQKQDVERLPRPGRFEPFHFASTENIDLYEGEAVEFFEHVLDMDYYDGFYSDGSMLEWFGPPDDQEALARMRITILERTRKHFGVDISAVYDEPLHVVLAKIREDRS
jgi:predicted RNase H-like HicB family nuclease